MTFDKDYYSFNSQDSDRPALWFYYRLWKRYCGVGPVLEFGCGVGHLARRLSATAKTFALEINPYAVNRISENAPEVEIIDSLSDLPDGELDSIVSLHVLEHIADADLAFIGKQFFRILKPGGRLLLVVPDVGGQASKSKKSRWLGLKDPTHINLKAASDWERLFDRKWGFKVIRTGADGYYDFPYSTTIFGRVFRDGGRLFRTAGQFVAGSLLLKCGDGEACIFVLEKRQ